MSYCNWNDRPDISMVCTECHVVYKARAGTHRDRKHCDSCRVLYYKAQQKAIGAVARAIVLGKLKSPIGQKCVDCDAPAQCLEHRDYTKPLDVQPTCFSCNGKRGAARWKSSQDFLPSKRKKRRSLMERADAPDCAAITLIGAP